MRRHCGAIAVAAALVIGLAGCTLAPSRSPPPSPPEATTDNRRTPRDGARGESRRPIPSNDDLGPLGSAAAPLLGTRPFAELVVEIDFVPGRQPTRSATSHLVETLRTVTGKPVSLAGGDRLPAGDGSYTLAEIRRLAEARSIPSRAPRASLWIAYLDGHLADDPNALGVAFAATAAALFPDRINEALTALVRAGAIERSVLLHEVGHLLSLVNVGYRSSVDHEDPEHPGHSSNRESVMYWAVEDVSVTTLLRGGPPDRFDDADLADLRMRRS